MSKIEWTNRPGTKSEVLNPTTGCDKVSRGCRSCYAEVMHKRLTGMGQPKYQQPFLGHVKFWPDELAKPFAWKKARTVFLNSMSDIFHKDVTVQQIAMIYAMMFLNDKHTFIVLTKRSEQAKDILNSKEFFIEYHNACNRLHDKYMQHLEQEMYQYDELQSMWPLRNVWQGVSAENQELFDERVADLMRTPAWIKVISIEPQVGPIDMFKRFESNQFIRFWVINGGESGHMATPMHPDWPRKLRDQCKYMGTPYFFKQWGRWGDEARAKKLLRPDQALGVFNPVYVYRDSGKVCEFDLTNYLDVDAGRCDWMFDLGKKDAGNFLDGVQHLEFPE